MGGTRNATRSTAAGVPDVVSDIFVSESALPVDVVLPSAAWADNEGVIVNSAARVFKINTGRHAVDPTEPPTVSER